MTAQKHYWRTQDSDFEKALLPVAESHEKSDARNNASPALQKATLQISARKCDALQNADSGESGHEKTSENAGTNALSEAFKVGSEGLEPPTLSV